MLLLGVGDDGHCGSLHPKSEHIKAQGDGTVTFGIFKAGKHQCLGVSEKRWCWDMFGASYKKLWDLNVMRIVLFFWLLLLFSFFFLGKMRVDGCCGTCWKTWSHSPKRNGRWVVAAVWPSLGCYFWTRSSLVLKQMTKCSDCQERNAQTSIWKQLEVFRVQNPQLELHNQPRQRDQDCHLHGRHVCFQEGDSCMWLG